MKTKLYIFAITLVVSLLTSCASRFAFIAPQTCVEATALKNVCSDLQFDINERIIADSLYNQGANYIRTGKNEKAYDLLDQSIVKYRLILVRHATARKEQEINFLKQKLAKDQEELSTCERIIRELTPTEQP